MTEKTMTLEGALDLFKKARDQWVNENVTKEAIERRVYRTLDARVTEIVVKLLGFEDRWGKWEVDHCNGRAGESEVGDFVRRVASKAVAKWLLEQMGDLPELPEDAVTSLKSEYLEVYYKTLRNSIASKAELQARNDIEEIYKKIIAGSIGKIEEIDWSDFR